MFLMHIFHPINWFIADSLKNITETLDWSQVISQATDFIQNFLNDFTLNAIPFVSDFFSNIKNDIRDFISQNNPELSSYLSPIETLLDGWKIAIIEKLEQILSNRELIANELANKVVQFIDLKTPIIQDILTQWQTNIQDIFIAKLSELQHNFERLITQNSNNVEPKLEQIKDLISNSGVKLEQVWRATLENSK